MTLEEGFERVKQLLGAGSSVRVHDGGIHAQKGAHPDAVFAYVPTSYEGEVQGTLRAKGLKEVDHVASLKWDWGVGHGGQDILRHVPAAFQPSDALAQIPKDVFAAEGKDVQILVYPEDQDHIFVMNNGATWMKKVPLQHGSSSLLVIRPQHDTTQRMFSSTFCTGVVYPDGVVFAAQQRGTTYDSVIQIMGYSRKRLQDASPISQFISDCGGRELLSMGTIQFALSENLGVLSLCDDDQNVTLHEAEFPNISGSIKFDVSYWLNMAPEFFELKPGSVVATTNNAFEGVFAGRR